MRLSPIRVEQMREVDRLMVDVYGVALLQMMENAGRSLAALTRSLAGGTVAGARVIVLAGPGNNSGGGLAAARHLANWSANVRVALAVNPPLPSIAAEHQRLALHAMGLPGVDAATTADLRALLAPRVIILDALIGYSLHGAPREPVASWIRAANATDATRVALDLPSGLDGDTGAPYDPTFHAEATLTLAWPKQGLLTPAARDVAGALYVADISVPEAVYDAVGAHRDDLFARGSIVRVQPVEGGEWAPGEPLADA